MLEVLKKDECGQQRAARYRAKEAATVPAVQPPAALPAVQPPAALPAVRPPAALPAVRPHAVKATISIVSTDTTFLVFTSSERCLTRHDKGKLHALASQNPAASFRLLPNHGDYLLHVETDVRILLGAEEWLTDPVINARLGLLQYHLRYVLDDRKTLILSTYLWV
jgi:hypothetical protein